MAGIAPKRRVGGGHVIRPALGVGRAELRRMCDDAGWVWREDATNLDESRLRAAIRARVVPELERIRPGAAVRAGRAAGVVRGAAKVVSARAAGLLTDEMVWSRAELRREPEVVLGELLRLAAGRLGGGHDRLSSAALFRVARAIRDRGTEPREFQVGVLAVEVTARRVMVKKAQGRGHKA